MAMVIVICTNPECKKMDIAYTSFIDTPYWCKSCGYPTRRPSEEEKRKFMELNKIKGEN